jgi:hypothetical protein
VAAAGSRQLRHLSHVDGLQRRPQDLRLRVLLFTPRIRRPRHE